MFPEDGIAVRCRTVDAQGPVQAGGTGDVGDDHRLPEDVRHLVHDDAGGKVAAAAGSPGDDDLNAFFRPGAAGMCREPPQHERRDQDAEKIFLHIIASLMDLQFEKQISGQLCFLI